MIAQALLDFLATHAEEAERALRHQRHLEHRDDLLAELWLVHHALSTAAHRTLDPHDPTDAALLLQTWRQRTRRDGDREQRRARPLRSADAPVQADLPGLSLIDLLPAEAESDPLEALNRLDAMLARLLAPSEFAATWSQPAGYLHLFEQVGERLRELALLCGAGDRALLLRLRRLVDVHRVQGRLFNGVHRLVASDVAPPRARLRHARPAAAPAAQPALWPGESA